MKYENALRTKTLPTNRFNIKVFTFLINHRPRKYLGWKPLTNTMLIIFIITTSNHLTGIK